MQNLLMRPRAAGAHPGNSFTCFAIWHEMWRNGRDHPHPRCGRDIQMRAPGKNQRRTCGGENGSSDEDEAEEEEAD
ncbi:hypothetical protein PI125_g12208 [Phytophthora idaei]|nr:hypothetical protein PI125_g12208 [Phytophthora idaei]KAG3150805.1 hypothetical protein PI126_g11295 [Phytophthora idaei]